MVRRTRAVTSLLLLMAPFWQTAQCAEPMDVGFELASNLPLAFREYLLAAKDLDTYALEASINPFYLQADFNGDGATDTVVFVRDKRSEKRGLLIVHGGTNEAHVLAAGTGFNGRGDDFSRFNSWRVYPRSVVPRSAHASTEPPKLQGDGLHLEVLESASGIIFWSGSEYSWYQQGD